MKAIETLFSTEQPRRMNGRFATPQQATNDRLRVRNQKLEMRNQYLERKLAALEGAIVRRELVYNNYPNKCINDLGDTNRQFVLWHDGGEWIISLKGKEETNCKTLREWLCGR